MMDSCVGCVVELILKPMRLMDLHMSVNDN